MKKIAGLILVLMLMINSPATAQEPSGTPAEQKVTVLMFLDSEIRQNESSIKDILAVVKEKFKQAEIIIHDDNSRKSPEYMELIESIKTDPVNEFWIRNIGINHLVKYAKDVNSRYIAVINITARQPYVSAMKLHLTVIDAEEGKYLINSAWHEGFLLPFPNLPSTAGRIVKHFGKEFPGFLPAASAGMEPGYSLPNERIKVVAILPESILKKPELVEKVRKTVSARFKASNVPIFVDGQAKSPEILELFARIYDDSAKQKYLVVKKEHLIKYGENTGATYVAAVIINISEVINYGSYYDIKYKENVFLVDVTEGRYAQNTVFESSFTSEPSDAIEYLLDKLLTDFKLR